MIMKITTFNPLIVTAHADDVIKLFEELGFEVRHVKDEIDSAASKDVRMKDANGNYVDIVQNDQMPRDMTNIRMNVDNFEEACEVLTSHGFKSTRSDGSISEDKTGKGIGMISPSGFIIAVAHHKK
jgi:predicted RNA binding protein YcfA (HicA-like mRNA interferase family)